MQHTQHCQTLRFTSYTLKKNCSKNLSKITFGFRKIRTFLHLLRISCNMLRIFPNYRHPRDFEIGSINEKRKDLKRSVLVKLGGFEAARNSSKFYAFRLYRLYISTFKIWRPALVFTPSSWSCE